MRNFILKNFSVDILVKLSNVFDDPVVDNAILTLSKKNGRLFFQFAILNNITTNLQSHLKSLPYKNLNLESFIIKDKPSNNFLERNKNKIVPLKKVLKISQGITTGGNNIFLMNKSEALKLNIEKVFIKKVVIGENIKKYFFDYNNNVILYVTKDKILNDRENQNIFYYLLPFRNKLSLKRETQNGKLPWYCLHWPRDENFILQPKILIRQTADKIIGTIDNSGYYPIDSIHFITLLDDNGCYNIMLKLKFYLAILNSKLFENLYRIKLDERGKVYPQIKKVIIDELPLIIANEREMNNISNLVYKILDLKKKGKDTSPLEDKIDKMVYELYGLTNDEIKIIEESTK